MSTWDRYRNARTTGLILYAEKGPNFESRGYCDDPTAEVEITKPPVAVLTMTPIVQFVNVPLTWDVSKSRSASGTISNYSLDFGDSILPPINNALWSGSKSGSVTYTVVGSWLAKLTVTDLLSVDSVPATVQVNIVEFPPGGLYVGSVNTGAWFATALGDIDINNNLTGDWLKFRCLRMTPQFKNMPQAQQHLWAATKAGIAYNVTGGNSNWFQIPRAAMGEPVGATTETSANMDCLDIAFYPGNWKTITVVRKDATTLQSWMYITTDYGQTWTNYKVTV